MEDLNSPTLTLNKSQTIRCFFAINFNIKTQNSLRKISRKLETSLSDSKIRWIEPDNLHITLRFLGQVALLHIPQMSIQVTKALRDFPSFDLTLSNPQLFPNEHHPRVLALQTEPVKTLTSLAYILEQAIVESGLSPADFHQETRAFRPHLSLARLFHPKHLKKLPPCAPITIKVNCLHLLESVSTKSGVMYRTLKQFPLLSTNDKNTSEPHSP